MLGSHAQRSDQGWPRNAPMIETASKRYVSYRVLSSSGSESVIKRLYFTPGKLPQRHPSHFSGAFGSESKV